jgi:uncharacterized BrkB/YihY/UPF0761 family membrane protein
MTRTNSENDPSLAPSADSPTTNRKKLRIGRGALVVGVAIALAAFAFYIGLGVYAGYHAAG